jgi:ubiquinone/menaquinone biosynthesis C-methylase UbiE
MKEYYEARAPEYDEWYLGLGKFAQRDRPGWEEDLQALQRAIASLPPARTLDVACGTGFLTRHLRGEITGLDQSEGMLEVAASRLPDATLVRGDALELPFADDAFDRVFTGSFYGHLHEDERTRFLAEAFRVAPELIVVDAAQREGQVPEEMQRRVLNDGSEYEVYKRYFDPQELAQELGGGTVVHASRWFVVVSSQRQ